MQDYVLVWHLGGAYVKAPMRGTADFMWHGWSNGGKNQNQKKSLGLPTILKQIPGPKTKPQNLTKSIRKKNRHRATQLGYTGTTTNLHIILNTPKNPYLNQASQKKPQIENFKP